MQAEFVTRIEIEYEGGIYESLVIDRAVATLAYSKELGANRKMLTSLYLPEEIPALLDDVWIEGLTKPFGDPPDALPEQNCCRTYTLALFTGSGKKHTLGGDFDKGGLPVEWEYFIERVMELVFGCVGSELFNEEIYSKAKRRKSDLTFCGVVFDPFDEDDYPYSYLADSDNYHLGDFVVVPVGHDNHDSVAKIVSIEYRQPENAPFPLEKTKHILRKYEK